MEWSQNQGIKCCRDAQLQVSYIESNLCKLYIVGWEPELTLFKDVPAENQKGTIAIDSVQQKRPSGSQWNMVE